MSTDTASNGTRAQNGRPWSPTFAIVGGGFGGVGASALLRRAGYRDVTVFEKGERLGGVWNFNTYPGAACDIPSHLYEFSFAPNPNWSRRFSPQEEIQEYIERVAIRYGVTDGLRLGTEVEKATWDEGEGRWHLETSGGPFDADILLTACGQLSVPKTPAIPGLDDFAGPAFHTAEWDHDVDLAGKRVAVVGTGCSAIQVVPEIQPIVEQVDVYQRSPGWTWPKMDFAYKERTKRLFEQFPVLQRIDRELVHGFMDLGAAALTSQRWMMPPFRALARHQITSAIDDPELRAKVTPDDEVGCKRLMLTDDWYPALTKPNVELIADGIDTVTKSGITAADGTEREADVIVLATGFDTHAFVAPMEIAGVEGRTLAEEWSEVPRAYLGMSVPSFPNMFLIYGPNTNGGTGSIVHVIECGMSHVLSALAELDRTGSRRIEPRAEAAERFDRELREALADTVWHTGCTSWYLDENGNDPNQWPWTWTRFRKRTQQIEPGAYELGAPAREREPAG
ncbi:MAG: flavin-containing monooxygenase [Solirubrobacterales bacterium]